MKPIGLILVILLVLSGCANFNHSESLSVDHFGATGTYSDNRSGALYELAFGAGAGAGSSSEAAALTATALAGSTGSGAGAGMLGLRLKSNQSQGDPRNFARSVAMVDLSKKLKSIKVDDVEGIREYEYVQPLAQYKKHAGSAFGYQPVE